MNTPLRDRVPKVALAKAEALGGRFKEARLLRNLTQEQVAEHIGISLNTLKRLERGDPSVSWGNMLILMDGYGMAYEVDGMMNPERDHVGRELLRVRAGGKKPSTEYDPDFD